MRDRIPWGYEVTMLTPKDIERRQQAESAKAQKLIEDRKKREAERAAARETAARERGAAELEAFREQSRQRWLHAGGTEAGFRESWSGIRDEYLRKRALEGPADRAEELYKRMKVGWEPRL
jgi:hypothetical protein